MPSGTDGDSSDKTVNIPIADDSLTETAETFTVTITIPGGDATLGSNRTATVTIADNESPSPGIIRLSSTAVNVNEDGTASLTVTRSSGSSGAASIDYATSNGTADAGSDYTATNGRFNWGAGEDDSKTIDVPIIDDSDDDDDETFTVTLSNVTGASLDDGNAQAAVTIIDNDSPPIAHGTITLPVATADVTEGDSITVTVQRTSGSDGEVSVYYETIHIDTDNGDYTSASDTLTWTDGNSDDKSIVIDTADDTETEDAEDFKVVLSSATGGAVIGNDTETITILANDAAAGVIGLSAATASVDENGGTITLTVSRTDGSDGAVSVAYTTVDDTATAGADYTSESGTLSWADGNADNQTIEIDITDDSDYEGDETFTVNLSGISGGAVYGTQETVVTIVEDDPEPNNDPVITDGPNADPTTVTLPNGCALDVTASDADGETLSYAWSKLSGPGSVSFTAQAANTTATFNAAGDYTLQVTVSDGKGGTASGTVDVTVNAAPTTGDADIECPATVAFGSTYVEDGSVIKTITISNAGTGVLLLQDVSLGGADAAAFGITADPALSIAANDSTTVEVTFDPSSEGSKSATLTIASNDPVDSSVTITLIGEALAGSTPVAPPPSGDDDDGGGCSIGFSGTGTGVLSVLLVLLVALMRRAMILGRE